MRIITGKARGKKLSAPEGLSTRPTSDRAKEAVFSVLQFSIAGRHVLDLFAGSGQMALEALSRGAASAVAVDISDEAIAVIRKNAAASGLEDGLTAVKSDALKWIERRKETGGEGFDIVFADPPYRACLLPPALSALARSGLLNPGATVVCESAAPEDVFGEDEKLRSEFDTVKVSKYGIACVTWLSPAKAGGSRVPEENRKGDDKNE